MGMRGHDVTVVCEDRGYGADPADEGLTMRRWTRSQRPNLAYYAKRLRSRWDVAERYALSELAFRAVDAAAAQRGPFDIVDTWMWGAEALAFPRHADGAKLIVRLSSSDAELRRHESLPARPDLDLLDARCLELADVVAAISEANLLDVEKEITRAPIAPKAVLTPLGIPVTAPPVAPSERSCRKEVLYVGRLEPRKGVEDLINALPLILAGDPEITVTIAGAEDDRPGRPSYEEVFRMVVPRADQGRVTFTGRLTDDERTCAYRRAALAVFPSRYESFGLVLLEAMVHATPVVATRVGGIPEVVDDSTAELVPAGSPERLAAVVLALLADPDRRDSLGRAGARHVRDRFTLDRMLDGTLRAYDKALGSRA